MTAKLFDSDYKINYNASKNYIIKYNVVKKKGINFFEKKKKESKVIGFIYVIDYIFVI